MRLVPALAWRLAGEGDGPLDERLLPLLEAIAASSSLAAAVAARGISYRAAWGLLRECEGIFGSPLVRLERGRGARLTAAGEALLSAQKTAARRLAKILPSLAIDVGPEPKDNAGAKARARKRVVPLRLRVAASHDLALAAWAEALPGTAAIELDLAVMGSLHALREFADGRADVAGFHVPIGRTGFDRAPFLRWLSARSDRLVHFVDREQGLILPRGNPSRVKSFRDLVTRELRFVNRQRGSGTRLLIDRLLDDAKIEATALNGYGTEEFTHPAVAATVASGGADAGFGLRAAASEYGLAFVPLARERYFLAARAKDLPKAPVVRLIDALRSPEFARLARRFPGYDAAGAGSVAGLDALAPAPRARSVSR